MLLSMSRTNPALEAANGFLAGYKLAIRLSAVGGSVRDEVAEIDTPKPQGCREHPVNMPGCVECGSEPADDCPYCGQDTCDCEKRGGVVASIVARRSANVRAFGPMRFV